MQARIEEMLKGNIWKDFGIKVIDAAEGETVIQLPIKEELTQFYGNVHGGILATVADMAMALAVNTLVAENEFTVTAEMKINYLRPASGKYLTAKGKVIKRGRTLSH
jgi:uncharacterized protein (TIGR00369 family)